MNRILFKDAPFTFAPTGLASKFALCCLVLSGSVLLPPLAGQATPLILAQAVHPLDQVQRLIDQQKYDQAWQSIVRLAQDADRRNAGSWFPIPTISTGDALLQEWSVKLAEAQVKTGHYQAAFQLANTSKSSGVQLAIAKALHQSSQKQLSERLLTQLAQRYRKLPQADAQGNLASLSGELFKWGLVATSDRLLEETIRTISPQYSQENQQMTILLNAGMATDSLERMLKIADRLDAYRHQTVLEMIARMAIRQKNSEVAVQMIQRLGQLTSSSAKLPPAFWAELYYDLAVVQLAQQQSSLGLASLSQATIYSQVVLDRPEWRDGQLERIAQLYQQQRQSQKAQAAAKKIRNPVLRQAVLAQLK